MITIKNQALAADELLKQYPEGSIENAILKVLLNSSETYNFSSKEELEFELKLRKEIINAANALYRSSMSFRIFRESTCNPDYWVRTDDGGFKLKEGVKPSDAVRDIFTNSSLYGTECATAMLIVYYKALLEVFGDDAFNKSFVNIYLMNWHRIEKELWEVGLMQTTKDSLPADRRYFANPDVDPIRPEWQGENTIDLGDGTFYGHGVGKYNKDALIKILNRQRVEDADDEAYLMDTVGRPNFKRLYELYNKAQASTITISYAG